MGQYLKHLIKHNGVYRRLIPLELEQTSMFPRDFTKFGLHSNNYEIPNGRRAFLIGNALVVGVVEKIGQNLALKIQMA